MTTEEFSNEFDILINSNSTIKPFGISTTAFEFDEYEKSVFLTEAQESIVTSLYKGTLTGDSFEKTEELRRYLNELVKTYSTSDKIYTNNGLTKYSTFFNIPKDTLFITYESVISNDLNLCKGSNVLEVVPVTQDELTKTLRNPFKAPNKRRVLRLDVKDYKVELISFYDILEYQIRYISKPEPIILCNLPEDLSIGKTDTFSGTEKNECKLNPAIHRTILEMAVNLAIKSRSTADKNQ